MQIHARVKVCTHTIARVGPQEQPCGPHAQSFTTPCNDNPSDRTLASLPTPWMDSRVLTGKIALTSVGSGEIFFQEIFSVIAIEVEQAGRGCNSLTDAPL
jgi:hypothetical protein